MSAENRAQVDFWDALAFGTADPAVKNPRTEAERRLNRRVEVSWWTVETADTTARRKLYGK